MTTDHATPCQKILPNESQRLSATDVPTSRRDVPAERGSVSKSGAAVSLELRLELSHIAMDVALQRASQRWDSVGTAAKTPYETLPVSAERGSVSMLRHLETLSRSAGTAVAAPCDSRLSPATTLSQAGNVVTERGWCRDWATDTSGAVCAMRAVEIAAGGQRSAVADALSLLLDRITAAFHGRFTSVPQWNDSRDVGREGVLKLLYGR